MSFLKIGFTSAALLAGGLFAMTPETADAQVRFQVGGSNGYGYNSGYGYNGHRSHAGHIHGDSGYGSNHYSWQRYNSGYEGYNNGFRQGSGHYDYHPTTVTPHRGHLDVQPGHYDYHRSGSYGH